MSKDNRTIHSHIRHGGKVFSPGMEDELQAAVSSTELERLQDKGAISGNFTGSAKAAKPIATADEAATPEPEPEQAAEEAPSAKGKSK